jgi:hypothetical protein
MARFSAGVLTTAGSTTLPIISLYGSAAVLPRIREIGLFNTSTTTAVALKLVRVSTTGTQGANLVEAATTTDTTTAVSTAWGTHTGAPTLGNDLGYRCVLPAQAGGSVIWTFEDYAMTVLQAANAGIAVIVENGTGQACQAYIMWQE